MINYYGSLCTVMYELLHPHAPEDELQFYLQYAKKEMKILEPLCGSGRFLVPFLERGFNITGFDMSEEMLKELYKKAPKAKVFQSSIEEFSPKEKYDYIFITSGSFSLFLDEDIAFNVLVKMKEALAPKGKFVFAAETTANIIPDREKYLENCHVKTKEGYDIIFKSKSFYDKHKKILSTPSLYELYDGDKLLGKEEMDFRIKLYNFGELDKLILKAGFKGSHVFSDFNRRESIDKNTETFLYECYI
ncbi:class I SAM-dependent methyltransferase [Clostridium botulinum]|uniref:class I SAM-dependent methyltransferase n=1 Tax=Clostridium botulinum TaxID=1491 RepID=UPI000773E387|nr:class I SAM-dependent methyltransferase [Clostridium botulinum]MBY6950083.1 class I SAM-dependent methyltransferase [Clostridium botulinum]MCR1138329.1 class I SAM-dependent methyltransferase [Clostridium botulinum]NEZ77889.1 class I SAM-dependent methyltransferase [Clostridium botulinum]NFA14959.1 class I SAM-dependent methyltransferase [Clostridium botulinum]NFA52606.1 class I SAM-dependent methyltransferase [Clostridium botulinum]